MKNDDRNKDLIPYRDPEALSEFLNQPQVKIAEVITGALSMGRSDAILVGGRIVQGALKGHLMKQLGRELIILQERGRIEEDYAGKKFGFQSLVELMAFIDSEVPDEDRFKAVKALFYSIIDKEAPDGSDILRYQLFQICKRLNSSQLLTVKACYRLYKQGFNSNNSAAVWLSTVAGEAGHRSVGLIENDETTLEREKLISGRTYTDRGGVNNRNARLTDLGISLVENIMNYADFAEEK